MSLSQVKKGEQGVVLIPLGKRKKKKKPHPSKKMKYFSKKSFDIKKVLSLPP